MTLLQLFIKFYNSRLQPTSIRLFSIMFYPSLLNLLGWHDTNCSMNSLIGSDILISRWICNFRREFSLSCPIDDLKQVFNRPMTLKELSLVAFVDGNRSINLAMLNSWRHRRWHRLSLIHSTRSLYVLNSGFRCRRISSSVSSSNAFKSV